MSDGRWHPWPEVRELLGDLVTPEQSFRACPVPWRVRYPLERVLELGANRTIRKTIELARVEQRGVGDTAEYRRPGAAGPAMSIGSARRIPVALDAEQVALLVASLAREEAAIRGGGLPDLTLAEQLSRLELVRLTRDQLQALTP